MAFRKGRRGRRTRSTVNLVRRRIYTLFELADQEAENGRIDLADRYVGMARTVSMRYNVRIPSHLKRRMCGDCRSYLPRSDLTMVRIRRGRIITHCKRCSGIMRRPIR